MDRRRKLRFLPIILGVFLLASCQENPFGPDSQAATDSFVNKVFPNGIWDFVIQLLAFVVLLVFVFLIGYKPVKKMLDKRKEGVQKMVDDAKANQEVAKRAADNASVTIEEGKQQAAAIVEEAKRQAALERAAMIASAQDEVAAMKKRADQDIEAAKVASREEVRSEIVDVALLASEKILGREVSSSDNKRLVSDFVKQMNEKEGEE